MAEIKLPLSTTDIQAIIPHRFPFLLVDRVTEFVDGEMIVGQKNVTANEHFFAGHFPGRPVMPGVLVLEAIAQLGALYARLCSGGVGPEKLIVFSGVEEARFRRVVVPGDVLTLTVNPISRKLGHWKTKGRATIGSELVAEAILTATEIK